MSGSGRSCELDRWDVLDVSLAALRECRTAEEVARRACALARQGCGAEAVALGTVRSGVWSSWCRDDAAHLLDAVGDGAGSSEAAGGWAAAVARSGRLDSRELVDGRHHVVVPLPGRGEEEVCWVLRLVVGPDLDALGLELVETFAAALASTMAMVALMQRAEEQRFVVARLVNGAGEVGDRAIEMLDTAGSGAGVPPRDRGAGPTATSSAGEGLSPRQREVLDLMVRGLSNAEIAERLVVTLPTVKSHVRAVLRACGAVNRSDAIARLARVGPAQG